MASATVEAEVAPRLVEVSGRVVDDRGNGVSGIRVARVWSFEESSWEPNGSEEESVRTLEDGSFKLALEQPGGRSVAIMAIDMERACGAIAETESSPDRETVILRLHPLSRTRAAFVSSGTKDHVPVTWSLHLSRSGARVAAGNAADGRLELALPRARYRLAIESENHQTGVVRLSVGKRGADLGTIALAPTVLAQLQGRLAPEIHVTSASGLPEGFRLTELRGKWILIDFWGYWCGPCVRGMPKLIEFWDEHGHQRSRFEILAFHDGTVASLEELQTKLAPARQELWMGKQLPFPVLVDSAGKTLERYGILSFPTLVLIDPEGRIVDSATGDGSRLLGRLANELR